MRNSYNSSSCLILATPRPGQGAPAAEGPGEAGPAAAQPEARPDYQHDNVVYDVIVKYTYYARYTILIVFPLLAAPLPLSRAQALSLALRLCLSLSPMCLCVSPPCF